MSWKDMIFSVDSPTLASRISELPPRDREWIDTRPRYFELSEFAEDSQNTTPKAHQAITHQLMNAIGDFDRQQKIMNRNNMAFWNTNVQMDKRGQEVLEDPDNFGFMIGHPDYSPFNDFGFLDKQKMKDLYLIENRTQAIQAFHAGMNRLILVNKFGAGVWYLFVGKGQDMGYLIAKGGGKPSPMGSTNRMSGDVHQIWSRFKKDHYIYVWNPERVGQYISSYNYPMSRRVG